jgi:hypothetical protein
MRLLDIFKKKPTKEVKIGRNIILLYNTTHELPIELYQKFNSYLVQKLGMQEIQSSIGNIGTLLNNNKIEEARQEVTNLYMGLYYTVKNFNIEYFCFGCLVYSINGLPVEDHSEDGLKRLIKELSDMGLTNADVKSYLDQVKKNLTLN